MEAAFAALGEPTRRKILEILAGGERAAGAIVDAIQSFAPTAQPTVSQHLKVLREAGLVTMRVDGNRRLYAINPAGVDGAQQWLHSLVDPLHRFEQPLDALATEVVRGKRSGAKVAQRPRTERADRTA